MKLFLPRKCYLFTVNVHIFLVFEALALSCPLRAVAIGLKILAEVTETTGYGAVGGHPTGILTTF